MRIRFDHSIQEFTYIDLVKAYDGTSGKLDTMSVFMITGAETMGDYVGEFDLDQISEAEAERIYEYISDQLLTLGWCEASDFGDVFTWY